MESQPQGDGGDEEERRCAAENRRELESVRCMQRAAAVHAALRRVHQARVQGAVRADGSVLKGRLYVTVECMNAMFVEHEKGWSGVADVLRRERGIALPQSLLQSDWKLASMEDDREKKRSYRVTH